MDPIALSSLTAAVSVIANEYLKGIASDAAKSTWAGIKSLFGWSSDPAPAEIPQRVAEAATASPELAEKLFALLKNNQTGMASALVSNLTVSSGGKVVIAQNITTLNM
jgi:hypothetical protein